MITRRELDHYRDHGFIRPQPLLTAAEAACYREACERTCIEMKHDFGRRHADNRVKPYLLFPWAAELVRHPGLLDMVEAVIGPDILVFHTTVWIKEAGSEAFVPWHQDATYFGLDPLEHVTAWVALTASTSEMGCLRLLPGSHREGQLQHRDRKEDRRVMLSRGQTVRRGVDEARAVDLEMAPGEVSFHHTLAMHSSGPNRSTDWRIGIGISYIPAHVRHVSPVRLTASLVRGRDRWGYFDPEPRPEPGGEEAAAAAHADSMARYWRASESIPEMQGIH